MIPRALLTQCAPDSARRFDEIASERVLAWYALRAQRPSWPSCFCDRISTAGDALEAILAPLADEVAQVRVSIREKEQELDSGEQYHVAVIFVVDEAVWIDDTGGREAVYKAFDGFVAELGKCKDIEVDREVSAVIPGNEFTWQDAQQTDQWNFANLSYRE